MYDTDQDIEDAASAEAVREASQRLNTAIEYATMTGLRVTVHVEDIYDHGKHPQPVTVPIVERVLTR